jgi:hypothetical protein
MKSTISEELKNEISDLKTRARIIGYKNVFPRLPKEQHTQTAFDNLMIGFEKRFQNWKNGLIQLENPGGTLNGKKRDEEDKQSGGIVDLRNYVINSFEDLGELA